MKKIILFLFLSSLLYSCSSEIPSPVNTSMAEFKWDFSKDKKIVYSLNQEQKMINDLLGEGKFDTSEHSMNGKIILDIKKNGNMDLILDSLKGKARYYATNSTQNAPTEIPHPKQLIPGFNEYGKNISQPNHSETLMGFFPLPYGEKTDKSYYEINTNMPFNAQGASLNVEGLRKISIKDSLKIRNHKCVKIEVETKYNEVEIPESLDGEYFCEVTSKFWGYFDYELGLYIEGHNNIKSKMLIETKTPNHDGQLTLRKMEMINFQKMNFTLDE